MKLVKYDINKMDNADGYRKSDNYKILEEFVEVVKNNKNKIEFQIRIEDSQKFELLRERYEILIS